MGDKLLNALILSIFHQYGYSALWLIIFVAAVGVPISGNLLLYAAGALAAFGDFNILILFIVGVSAAVMGDNLGYYIGWKIGKPFLVWLEKQQRFRFITPDAMERGRAYFRRRAAWAIFVSRFLILVLGGPINWLAGAERYSFRKFVFWSLCGQILGAIIPLGLGYLFAASWGKIENLLGDFSSILLAVFIGGFIIFLIIRKLREKRGKLTVEVSTTEADAEIIEPLLQAEALVDVEHNLLTQENYPADEYPNLHTYVKWSKEIAVKTSRPTILILISHSGGGHLNLAQSLRDILTAHYNVVILDPQSRTVEQWYTWVSRHFMRFLYWQFIWTDNKIASWGLQNILTLLGLKQFMRVIEEVEPDLIITTHAMVSYVTARAIETSKKSIPLVFQFTDLERLHMTWFVEKQADAYFAPTREILAQSKQQEIDTARLHTTGRPIRRQFLEVDLNRRYETLTSLGFDPSMFTIFLQGGAKGSASMSVDRTIKNIQATNIPIQIILAAGNNKTMAAQYANVDHIYVLPFTENIAPYMAAVDVIVGKAGASFITEAFMVEKPFIVTAIIPGQETPSLAFIERYNLGWTCLESYEQIELLTKLVHNPTMIATKINNIREYKTWNIQANQEILPIIDQLLDRAAEQQIEDLEMDQTFTQ
jgi:UDP-N-acetylglucosamine:LPS N-acetylglucosamine transferase/membrane protein DedA with SNARE-associated domain